MISRYLVFNLREGSFIENYMNWILLLHLIPMWTDCITKNCNAGRDFISCFSRLISGSNYGKMRVAVFKDVVIFANIGWIGCGSLECYETCNVGKGSELILMHLLQSHHQPNYFLPSHNNKNLFFSDLFPCGYKYVHFT